MDLRSKTIKTGQTISYVWSVNLGRLVLDLRRARGLSQEALAALADVSRSTVAKLEGSRNSKLHDANARRVLLVLGAAAPLTDEQCAHYLELSGLSRRSHNGVLDDQDRATWIEQGVIVDPADPEQRLRPARHAVRVYGARVARVLDVQMDRVAFARPPVLGAAGPEGAGSTPSMVRTAHDIVDELAARGEALAALAALVTAKGQVETRARAAAAAAAPPVQSPPLVPDKHTAYPGEGRAVTEYSPPPADAAPAPAPQARRKSG